MKSIEFAPSPRLQPYVQLLWCLELDAPGDFGPPARIAPDGIVELVVQYGEPMEVRFAQAPFVRQPRSSLVVQKRRYLEFHPRGATGLISVRFRPWGAHHFLQTPISEAVRQLEEQLAEATQTRARVALVEQFLLRRFGDDGRVDVEPLVRAVWKGKGHARVAGLCGEVGLTERTLERIFAATLAMPPRSYLRLARFLHACSVLRRRRFLTLTEVAHDCGYYDQAHFIGDFKAFSGVTPAEFLASRTFSFLEIG
jgi:AraC-like DNA-binding protein